jgi:Ca2+-binding EF-hand superfamily protein
MISKGQHQNPTEIFEKEDENGDGFITIDEFTGPK